MVVDESVKRLEILAQLLRFGALNLQRYLRLLGHLGLDQVEEVFLESLADAIFLI